MSLTIKKSEDIVLTRSQFEKLKQDGKLIVGSTYKIKDDPTANDLVDGIVISKKAERDSNNEIISDTYRRKDDSYSISDIDAKFNNNSEYLNSELNILKDAITSTRNDLSILREQSVNISLFNDQINGLQEQINNKITTGNTTDNLQPGQYTFLTIEE